MDCKIRFFIIIGIIEFKNNFNWIILGSWWWNNWSNIEETTVILFIELEDKMFAAVWVSTQKH